MRILLLVHQYPPDHIGGTELYTQAVAEILAQRGHQVTVFYRGATRGTSLERREEGSVAIWRAPSAGSAHRRFLATFRDASIAQGFAHVLHEARPDWLYVQHLMGFPVAILRSARERDIPVAVTLHDYWWVCANAQLLTNYDGRLCAGPRAYLNCARCLLARAGIGNWWPAVPAAALAASWRSQQLRSALLGANRLVAPSRFVQKWYNAHGIPQERIEVLPHGLQWPASSERTRSPLDKAPGEPVRLLYIGGLAWQKGVHVLLQAFSQVRGPAELWIAGDESADLAYVARLRAQASSAVRFLGPLSRDQVWEALSRVDVLTVPSLWHETFSLVTHEAFAAGVPVLASRVGALSEAVHDGMDGLLLPPGDVAAWRAALQRLVDEPDLCERLRANVRRPMTLESHVQHLESLLRS